MTSRNPRLRARPSGTLPIALGPAGMHKLDIGGGRDSYCYVPATYSPQEPAPLVLLLHGAGGHSHAGLDLLRHLADDHGMILAAPASAAHTWDVIVARAYGEDVVLADRALEHLFRNYAVDSAHVAIGGFSDGASYALSLGLANGDLFTHVIAFSPGFVAPVSTQGQPSVFISHGRQDDVLPVEPCSRRIVPQLERAGYAVRYEEFEGGHTIPAHIARMAMDWFLRGA